MSSGPFTQTGTAANASQIAATNSQPWTISGAGGVVQWIGNAFNPPPISSQFMRLTKYGLSIPPNATVIAAEVTIPVVTFQIFEWGFNGLLALISCRLDQTPTLPRVSPGRHSGMIPGFTSNSGVMD